MKKTLDIVVIFKNKTSYIVEYNTCALLKMYTINYKVLIIRVTKLFQVLHFNLTIFEKEII